MASFLDKVGEGLVGLFSKDAAAKLKGQEKAKAPATNGRPGKPAPAASKAGGSSKPKAKPQPQIRIAKNVYWRNAFKRLASVFSFLILTVVVIYLCFAVTILRVVPTTTDLGFVPVKNNTHPGGVAPPGSKLLMDLKEPQDEGMLSHVKQAFLMHSDVALVEVVAGPYGKMNWAPGGLVTVDGLPVPVLLEERPQEEYLKGEYLVVCLGGACVEGEGLLLPASHIIGEPISLQRRGK